MWLHEAWLGVRWKNYYFLSAERDQRWAASVIALFDGKQLICWCQLSTCYTCKFCVTQATYTAPHAVMPCKMYIKYSQWGQYTMLIPNHSVNNTCEFCAGQKNSSEGYSFYITCIVFLRMICQIKFFWHNLNCANWIFTWQKNMQSQYFTKCLSNQNRCHIRTLTTLLSQEKPSYHYSIEK